MTFSFSVSSDSKFFPILTHPLSPIFKDTQSRELSRVQSDNSQSLDSFETARLEG